MGQCLCRKNENNETVQIEPLPTKTYSWDEKRKLPFKATDFIIDELQQQEEIRLPGSVNGQQFIIQNCKDSTIYILDHINSITIDDCSNCKFILGPVEGSAFIRNCKSCTCIVACGQFRMRDSIKINVFLFSATQPVIEASKGISFGTYHLHYNGINNHFQKAKLNCKNVNWEVIYDFTPIDCEENWNFLKVDKITDYISDPQSEVIKNDLQNLGCFWSP